MNTQRHEKMYRIIRDQVLNKYINELAEVKPVQKDGGKGRRQLFEVYEYEDDADIQLDIEYDEVEQQMKQQINRQYNEYLCECQTSELKMQIFLLDKEIAIELDEIQLLQNKIKNYQSTIKTQTIHHHSNKTPINIKHDKQQQSNQTVKIKQSVRDKKRMCLVPNFRVEVPPQRTIDQKLDKTMQKYDQLRELLIKDIESRNKQTKHTIQQTVKVEQKHVQQTERKSKAHHMNDLILAQRNILQCKQNWMTQKHDHKKAKQAKRKLKQQLAEFWQQAQHYQNI